MNKIHERMWEGRGKGFTLIELLIVIAVLGILAAIAVPTFLGQRTKAKQKEAVQNLKILSLLETEFFADNGVYAPWPEDTEKTYLGTHGTDDEGLEDYLRSFKPGKLADLNFDYKIIAENNGTTFTATASGKSGTEFDGIDLTINQDNEIESP